MTDDFYTNHTDVLVFSSALKMIYYLLSYKFLHCTQWFFFYKAWWPFGWRCICVTQVKLLFLQHDTVWGCVLFALFCFESCTHYRVPALARLTCTATRLHLECKAQCLLSNIQHPLWRIFLHLSNVTHITPFNCFGFMLIIIIYILFWKILAFWGIKKKSPQLSDFGFAQAVGWDKVYTAKINRWAPLRHACHLSTYFRTFPPKKLQLATNDDSMRPAAEAVPVTSSLPSGRGLTFHGTAVASPCLPALWEAGRQWPLTSSPETPPSWPQPGWRCSGSTGWPSWLSVQGRGGKEDTPPSLASQQGCHGFFFSLSLSPLRKGPPTSCMASISLVRW